VDHLAFISRETCSKILKSFIKASTKAKYQVENTDLDRGILSFVTKPQAPCYLTDSFRLPHTTHAEAKVPQQPPS